MPVGERLEAPRRRKKRAADSQKLGGMNEQRRK
jgi:hypothetical protein